MRLPGSTLSILLPGLALCLAVLCGPLRADAGAAPWDLAANPHDDSLPLSATFAPSSRPAGSPAAADDLPASLGQGVAAVLSGRPGPGADQLAAMAGRAGDLADVAAYYQGLGRYLDGQPDRARQALATLAAHPTTHFLGRDALYLSILCAARLGDHQATAALAKTWLANPDPRLAPAVWLRAAVAAGELGDTAKRQDFLRHLSLFAPWTKAAKAGDALARSLCATAAADRSACYDPDRPGNVLLRAEALAEKGYAAAALTLLQAVPAGEAAGTARADYIRGKAFYALRRTAAAREAFARAAAEDPAGTLAGWALYHEARCLWRSLDPADSARMEALLRQVLQMPGRDDRLREAAARHLALVLAEQGKFPQALAAAESLSGLAVSPDLAAQGASLAAVLAFVTGDFAKAEAACAAFLTRFPDDDWADGARYWRAKALLALSRPAEAAALLRTVVATRPNTYYGGLASKALPGLPAAPSPATAAPGEARPLRCPDTVQPADPGVAAVLAMAGQLRQAGLPQLAERLLAFATHRARRRVDLAMAHIRTANAVGLRLAGVRTAWRTFGGCLLRGSAEALAPLRPYLYPRSNAETVRAALAGSGVDPDIIFALIRQESFFDPRAVSGAGAVGLMQLLPGTARTVGKRLGLRVQRADLFDPQENIRLGTAFFLERLSRSGNLPAALAGYNAGANRVAVWNATLAPLGQELFIELIPYTETRNYVRRILTNAMMYQRLYAASGR